MAASWIWSARACRRTSITVESHGLLAGSLEVTVAAVVLAAGAGTRYRGPTSKLLAEIGGRPLVARVVDAALAAELDATYVVEGAVELGAALPAGSIVVANPAWAGGLATSLGAAIEAARRDGHDAVVVGLGDQPLVAAEAWRRVGRSDPAAALVVAVYGTARGHPVRLGQQVWSDLPTVGDVGAGRLLAARADLVVEVACPGSAADVDTIDDLARLGGSSLRARARAGAPGPGPTDRGRAGHPPTRRSEPGKRTETEPSRSGDIAENGAQ